MWKPDTLAIGSVSVAASERISASGEYPPGVTSLPMSDDSILQDVDTPAALNALRNAES